MSELLDAKKNNPRQGGPSFSFRNRCERLMFSIVWGIIEFVCPLPIHPLRRVILNLFGARLHPTAKVYPRARIWYPRNLVMAEYSCIATRVNCYNMAEISLGPYALVSQGAHLCAGTHDVDDSNFQLVVKPISIGQNAWVAAEAFVGPGSVMCEGAVLGARGVLFGRIEAWNIAAGNPLRVLRQRKNWG